MFFLYNMFNDKDSLNSTGNNINVNTLVISNGIFDHLNLLDKIHDYSDVDNFNKPDDWNESTLLNVTFDNTIDGGTLSQFIGNVDHLEIQRKEQGSDDWITLQNIYKNNETNSLNATFTFEDTYNKNNTIYNYRVVAVDVNGNIGTAIEKEVLSIFNDSYIADSSHIYKITNEYSKSSQTNQINAVYTPYGSKYPIVAYNAVTQYDSGTITAVLLAPTSQSQKSSYLDRVAQTNLIKEFNSWLTNGRAKILKDFNGDLKVITIVDAVPNSYYKDLGNGLASSSFNYIEVGDLSQNSLNKLGMVNQFNLKYKV